MVQQLDREYGVFSRRVRAAAESRALSHAIILSGGGDLTAAGRFIAAAHLCRQDRPPCLACNTCRKVLEGIHPDVITVQDPQRRELAVEDLRELKRDVYIRPNEGERKVYLFADCAQLNERDQNVLLKVVEEGPPYAAFVFCCAAAHSLLPTVRSRCVELRLDQQGETTLSEDSAALCRLIGGGDVTALAAYLTDLETSRQRRETLQPLLLDAWGVASQALLVRRGKTPERSFAAYTAALAPLEDRQLLILAEALRRAAEALDFNAGVGHVLGALLAEIQQEVFKK